MAMSYDIAMMWNHHQRFHRFYNFHLSVGLTIKCSVSQTVDSSSNFVDTKKARKPKFPRLSNKLLFELCLVNRSKLLQICKVISRVLLVLCIHRISVCGI